MGGKIDPPVSAPRTLRRPAALTQPAVTMPLGMMRFMTFELAEALMKLSQQQVQAIWRIIESGHLVEEPLAPYSLIRGDNPICSESVWKRTGRRRKNGSWSESPGWSHQEEFIAALKLAKRQVLAQVSAENVTSLRRGRTILQRGMPEASRRMVELATGYQVGSDGEFVKDDAGKPVAVTVEHKDQIAASKFVIDTALEQERLMKEEESANSAQAQAWWDAAEME